MTNDLKTTFGKILKVALWTGGSATLVSLVDQFTAVDWNALLGEKAPYAVAAVNIFAFTVIQLRDKQS